MSDLNTVAQLDALMATMRRWGATRVRVGNVSVTLGTEPRHTRIEDRMAGVPATVPAPPLRVVQPEPEPEDADLTPEDAADVKAYDEWVRGKPAEAIG